MTAKPEPIPAPAAGIPPLPEGEVDASLRPFMQPLSDYDLDDLDHNLRRTGSRSPLRRLEAMRARQLQRAEQRRKGEAAAAVMQAAVSPPCPACGGRRTPLDPWVLRDVSTELCGACRGEEQRQVLAELAEERLADGRTRAEAVTAYRQTMEEEKAATAAGGAR